MIKLINILEEIQSNKILIPRRSKEERDKNYLNVINKQIQQYIKDGGKGDLDLHNTPITSLPNELKVVGGNLYLAYTKITSLPDGLTVGGNLYLHDTPIISLPDGLKVGGDIYLNNTEIQNKYTREQIRQMYPGVEGDIYL